MQSKELSQDEHQISVVNQFDRLYTRLSSYSLPPIVIGQSFLEQFLFGKAKATRIPKGIYLWGTVGGGKTMLMDLFFDTILESKCFIFSHEYNYIINPNSDSDDQGENIKRRMHYHNFMQEVHELINMAKKKVPPRDVTHWDTYQPYDPIPPVGEALLEKAWLLCLDEFQVKKY